MVRMSPLCILLLACGLLPSHAAGGCNNPLFAVSQWPSNYTRPPYLTDPTTWQQESPQLCPEIDPTNSCCNAETASGLINVYMSNMGSWYEQWISVDGIIQDTFNDFNPVTQQMKLNYGWTADGSGMGSGSSTSANTTVATSNSTMSPPTPTTSPTTVSSPPSTGASTGTTTYLPVKPDQAVIDAAFSSSPTAGVPDSYASIKLTTGDYVWYDFWPYGRIKSRSRTGILKLQNSTQTELRHKANDMNGYMMQLSYYNYECQNAFKQQMMGMLCMGCDPSWADWVKTSSSSINVLINSDSCSALYSSCKGFLRLYQDIPALVSAMTSAVKNAITADPNYAAVSSSIYLSDLDNVINAKSAALCDGKAACQNLLCTSFAAGASGIFPDRKLISDPAGLITGKGSRILASTVTFQEDSNGYDAMGAGMGESSMIIPMTYATYNAPGTASDATTGSRTAPFADGIDAAARLWVGAALFSVLLGF